MQTTDKVFMVRPVAFAYNEETAVNNDFQSKTESENTQTKALKEFDEYVKLLKENGVKVVTVNDTPKPHTPDSIFPNNWFSTHSNGELVIYSMCAKNRRNERKKEFIEAIQNNFKVNETIDFSSNESKNEFLEGTGSMVLDRENHIVYACKSIRTSVKLLDLFAETMGYTVCLFESFSRNNNPIYHTNVVMSVGTDYAVICLESIKDEAQSNKVVESLNSTGKAIVDITLDQLEHFCGNILELKNKENKKLLVMSKTAYNAFTKEQLEILSKDKKIITPDITTIETNGGGSARCMLAELF